MRAMSSKNECEHCAHYLGVRSACRICNVFGNIPRPVVIVQLHHACPYARDI